MSRNNDDPKLALLKEHEAIFKLIMAKYKVKKEMEEDVYDSMVLVLFEAKAEYGEAYETVLLDRLCKATEECLRIMSYSGKIFEEEPYYDMTAELDELCSAYTMTVISQAARANAIVAAVNQLVATT